MLKLREGLRGKSHVKIGGRGLRGWSHVQFFGRGEGVEGREPCSNLWEGLEGYPDSCSTSSMSYCR